VQSAIAIVWNMQLPSGGGVSGLVRVLAHDGEQLEVALRAAPRVPVGRPLAMTAALAICSTPAANGAC
jgi:hypothetical protein